MARLVSQMSFTEEIEFNDIEFEKVVGKGAFGVVSKATWKGINVAVKMIESEEEIKAFRVEVRQLSRVEHPNIVTLYGACTTQPVCLVMEFAEGGSLYNVLHSPKPQPIYKAAHAMSWALQCARGVAYLHGMAPKKLIHRDLKPANLLLMSGGTVLKICDFGTACDFQTYMTNNKGSAAWMAPEVFEGSQYSEKCDVFSWGVILWEVISRKKPFDEIGGPAFRIMWAVHNGRRPPLIRNIPKPLETLMTRCWSKEPHQRPSMEKVVNIMSDLMQFFRGADQPLVYPQLSDEERTSSENPMMNRLEERTADLSLASNQSMDSRGSTVSDTIIHSSSSHSNGPQEQQVETHVAFSQLGGLHLNVNKDQKKRHSMDLLDLRVDEDNTAKSAVQTHRRSSSHGRILDQNFPTEFLPLVPTSMPNPAHPPPPSQFRPSQTPGHAAGTHAPPINYPTSPSSNPTSPVQHPTHHHQVQPTTPPTPVSTPPPHSASVPSNLSDIDFTRQRPNSYHPENACSPVNPHPLAHNRHSAIELRQQHTPHPIFPSFPHPAVLEGRMGTTGGSPTPSAGGSAAGPARYDRSLSLDQRVTNRVKSDDSDISMAYSTLEPHLQPLPPNRNSRESLDIFDEHMKMAQEYLRVQTEIALFHTRKKELADALDQDWKDKQASFRLVEEHSTLSLEKESLLELHKRRRSQLDMFRLQIQQRQQHQQQHLQQQQQLQYPQQYPSNRRM